MKNYTLFGREVTDMEIELEINEGCYVTAARWADTGAELTDIELDELEHIHQTSLYEEAYANAASAAYDSLKGDW